MLADDVKWMFPGYHPVSGTKVGVDEVIAFFDTLGGLMGKSNVKVEKLVTGVNDDYVVECQHISTDREDDHNLDQHWCVLWKFEKREDHGGPALGSRPTCGRRILHKTYDLVELFPGDSTSARKPRCLLVRPG